MCDGVYLCEKRLYCVVNVVVGGTGVVERRLEWNKNGKFIIY